MFHKVLVGVNGQDGGLDAAALARQLVARDGELVLAHIHPDYHIAAKGETGDYERVVRDDVQQLLAQASEQTGIRTVVAHGAWPVGKGLQELAERESADLVVVGSTRRGLAARIFIGDDTRSTLTAVRGAVAVAPAGYAEREHAIRKVGVAYDTSRESRQAAAVASELGRALDAKLSAIEIVDIPMYMFYSEHRPDETDKPLDVAANEVARLGEFEPQVEFGSVSEGLADATNTVDLLVMGSRGLGRVRQRLQDSRSQYLARVARCPLLILTETASEGHHEDNPTDQPVSAGS